LFLVDGTIAGRPYRFLLDSGAALSQVEADEHIAALPVVRMDTSRGAHAGRTEPVVTLTDVAFGPLRLGALDAKRVEPIPGLIRNLVGMDVLSQHRCHFRLASPDLTGSVLELDGPADLAGGLDLQTSSRGHAYVDVHWPGVTARACWDTGAAGTVVNRDFRLAHPGLFEEVGMSAGTDSTGTRVETPVLLMAGAEIGGRVFSPSTAFSVDLTEANRAIDVPMDLILGYPALRQADWLFDFPAGKWQLTSA